MIKQHKKILLVVVGVVLILIAGAILQEGTNESTILPQTLGDMEMKMYVDGEEALREVARLHSSGESVSPDDAYIARYRNYGTDPANKADVWVSISDSEETALDLVSIMTSRMKGGLMFSDPQVREIDGQTMYYTEGIDQYHYFYAKGTSVVWIGLSNPDVLYQEDIISQALKNIN